MTSNTFAASFRRVWWVTMIFAAWAAPCIVANGSAGAAPINIVAVGASITAGWGVGADNAYPSQLQGMLRAKGYDAHVTASGVPFQTTGGMLERLDSAVPRGTSIVILQPGSNDLRFFGSEQQRNANIAAIVRQLRARNIKVIVFENSIVPREDFQWDGIHFTTKGHTFVAAHLMPQVIAALTPHEPKPSTASASETPQN